MLYEVITPRGLAARPDRRGGGRLCVFPSVAGRPTGLAREGARLRPDLRI